MFEGRGGVQSPACLINAAVIMNMFGVFKIFLKLSEVRSMTFKFCHTRTEAFHQSKVPISIYKISFASKHRNNSVVNSNLLSMLYSKTRYKSKQERNDWERNKAMNASNFLNTSEVYGR